MHTWLDSSIVKYEFISIWSPIVQKLAVLLKNANQIMNDLDSCNIIWAIIYIWHIWYPEIIICRIFRISTILLKTSFMKSVFIKKICPDVSNFVNVDNIMRQNRHNAEQTNPFYHEICFCDQCKRVISTRYPRVSFPSIYTIFKWLFLPVVIRYNMPI